MAELTLDSAAVTGFLLAMIRVTGFVIASPMLGSRVPATGRLAIIIAIGLFLTQPVSGSLTVARLIDLVIVNLVIGLVLGFLTGLIFQLFAAAGSMIDLSAGLGIGAVFDPLTGANNAVFSRLFDMTALTMFFVIGGHRLLVAGLDHSVDAVALDGALQLDPRLGDVLVDLSARFLIAGLELAMPAIAALFLTEVTLGVAARLMPQANVFIVGLPAKLLVAMAAALVVLTAFPHTITGVTNVIQNVFTSTL